MLLMEPNNAKKPYCCFINNVFRDIVQESKYVIYELGCNIPLCTQKYCIFSSARIFRLHCKDNGRYGEAVSAVEMDWFPYKLFGYYITWRKKPLKYFLICLTNQVCRKNKKNPKPRQGATNSDLKLLQIITASNYYAPKTLVFD